MGCLESLPYEVILRYASFAECRKYVEKHYTEIYEVPPGFGLFGLHLIGIPPLLLAVEEEEIIFPFTKPCHGTFLVRTKGDPEDLDHVRKRGQKRR